VSVIKKKFQFIFLQVPKRSRSKEKVSFTATTSTTTDSSIPHYQTQKTNEKQEWAYFYGKD